MAKWISAPSSEQDGASAQGAEDAEAASDAGFAFDIGQWSIDSFASVTMAGIQVPTAAIALPFAVFALYLAFASSRRRYNRAIQPGAGHDRPEAQTVTSSGQ
ncbi:MAG: hypothetical protein AB8B85_00415 [Paracoccaceae bacterium]